MSALPQLGCVHETHETQNAWDVVPRMIRFWHKLSYNYDRQTVIQLMSITITRTEVCSPGLHFKLRPLHWGFQINARPQMPGIMVSTATWTPVLYQTPAWWHGGRLLLQYWLHWVRNGGEFVLGAVRDEIHWLVEVLPRQSQDTNLLHIVEDKGAPTFLPFFSHLLFLHLQPPCSSTSLLRRSLRGKPTNVHHQLPRKPAMHSHCFHLAHKKCSQKYLFATNRHSVWMVMLKGKELQCRTICKEIECSKVWPDQLNTSLLRLNNWDFGQAAPFKHWSCCARYCSEHIYCSRGAWAWIRHTWQ